MRKGVITPLKTELSFEVTNRDQSLQYTTIIAELVVAISVNVLGKVILKDTNVNNGVHPVDRSRQVLIFPLPA